MKHRRFLAAALAFILVFLLSGCQLAQEGAGTESGGDKLIGAFVTRDSFSLDELALTGGENVHMEQGRLYATVDRDAYGHADQADFGGVEGVYLICPTWTDEDGEAWEEQFSEGFCDIHRNIEVTDSGKNDTIEGTIYILPGTPDDDLDNFVNPVYQTADGEIYAVEGEGYGVGIDISEGEVFTTTMTETVTMTENGVPTSESNTVSVHIAVMYRPTQITLVQMDSGNQLVRSDAYTPGEVPEQLTMEADTAYLIVETTKTAPNGETVFTRQIAEPQPDDEGETVLQTFYAKDDITVSVRSTDLIWGK